MIRFVMRGRASALTFAHDDLVASREGEALELVRAQETELPQALKLQVARADEDYDRCPKVFLSAVALAATVMFWL